VAIMGTSTCHIVLSDDAPIIPGACGVVADGVIPGCSDMKRASRRGDIFAWFVDNCVPPLYHDRARSAA